jgi:ComF family protein
VRKGSDGLRCAGAVWYEESVRDALLRFKFQGVSDAAEPLGELLAHCAAEQFGGEFDMVTWVPVSRKRLRSRGYDQAELLARAACRLWETEPVCLLEKVMDNPPQSGLNEAAARRANVLGVYDAVGEIEGKRILLVDDICTTGSTLAECVRVLEEAGAESVVCAVVAFTRQGNVHKSATE